MMPAGAGVKAGQNVGRLRSEAAFAHPCGVDPIPASSGKTTRHRLNLGGDRDANTALMPRAAAAAATSARSASGRPRRPAKTARAITPPTRPP